MKKIFSLVLLFIFLFVHNTPTAHAATDIVHDATLSTSLQGCWNMDEASGNRLDSTANANTLTDNNTVASAAGKINNGADFELSNSEWLSRTDASQVGLDITGNLSISFWIKLEQLPSTAAADMGLVDKMVWTAGSRQGYSLSIDSGNNLQFFAYDVASNLSRYGVTTFFSAGDVGNFVHVAIAWTAASPATMLIYKNGVAQTVTTSGSAATSIANNAIDFNIGRYNSANYEDGIIDEAAIWSKTITTGEIASLYNSGSAIPCFITPATRLNSPIFLFE